MRRFVESLDGTRTLDELIARGDLDEQTIREVVRMLADRGVLDDASVRPEPLRGLSVAERDRLGPDLDALSLSAADAGDGGLAASATVARPTSGCTARAGSAPRSSRFSPPRRSATCA